MSNFEESVVDRLSVQAESGQEESVVDPVVDPEKLLLQAESAQDISDKEAIDYEGFLSELNNKNINSVITNLSREDKLNNLFDENDISNGYPVKETYFNKACLNIHTKNNSQQINDVIDKFVLLVIYFVKLYQLRSYFDIPSKLISSDWESYLIYKTAKNAFKKVIILIKKYEQMPCIFNAYSNADIAELIISYMIDNYNVVQNTFEKNGSIVSGAFAGMSVGTAAASQIITFLLATNFDSIKTIQLETPTLKIYLSLLLNNIQFKSLISNNSLTIELSNNQYNLNFAFQRYRDWKQEKTNKFVANNLSIIEGEILQRSRYRNIRNEISKKGKSFMKRLTRKLRFKRAAVVPADADGGKYKKSKKKKRRK